MRDTYNYIFYLPWNLQFGLWVFSFYLYMVFKLTQFGPIGDQGINNEILYFQFL